MHVIYICSIHLYEFYDNAIKDMDDTTKVLYISVSVAAHNTVCPQKIRSLGIETIFDAVFYED